MKRILPLILVTFFILQGCGIKKSLPLGRYDYQSPVHGDLARMIGQSASIKAVDAEYDALLAPIGQKIYWSYNDGNKKGFVVALRESTKGGNLICREFQHVVTTYDPPRKLYSGKCMKEGYWR